MEQKDQQKKDKDGNKIPLPKGPKFNYYWLYGLVAVLLLGLQFLNLQPNINKVSRSVFEEKMLKTGDVEKVVVVNEKTVEVFIKPELIGGSKYDSLSKEGFLGAPNPHYQFTIGSLEHFEQRLEKAQESIAPSEQVDVVYQTRTEWGGFILQWIVPIVLIVLIWIFIMRRVAGGAGGPGGQIFNIGKSKAQLFEQGSKVSVTFNDVAGLEEAKEEILEVVDFLKNPKKYTALGGKIPKGVLLVGAPGTGKTLIAKAMAGEADVPFFSISGSDFVELFVGVGASRVRDLFKQAREKAPCIIFIDEIDAIGRARGKSMVQGNDERENTLNQLLVEMDGFSSEKGVIILAATNRPDVLDSALLRPGRFDRQIGIDRPDLQGREAIFKVHLKPVKVGEDIDAAKLAAQTPGFAGAEIANICNEAALIAARNAKKSVEMEDFQSAIDRVIGGLEKKNKIISPEEKKIIAYHEAGHAICGWYLEHADPLVKVSIVPRGIAALGYAQYLPKEQYLYTTEQLMDGICMALGGRAAEEIVFGSITTGAQNDLERITKTAHAMVSVYGMNDRIGNLSYNDPNSEYSFKKPYSEDTAKIIDEEVAKLIEGAFERTKALLTDKREELEALAHELLEREIIFQSDIERLVGKRPFDTKEEEATNGAAPESELKSEDETKEIAENETTTGDGDEVSSETTEPESTAPQDKPA